MVRLSAGPLAAVQFLTRVPVRLRRAPALGTAAPWFPIVGAAIGAAVGGAAAGLWHVVPALVAASLAVALGVLITGAFHEDGLADVADSFAGGWTRERRLEILKDPRHGTYGVAALASSLLVRVASVATMPPAVAFGSLVAAHSLGRAGAVVAMVTSPVATEDGLGAGFVRDVRRAAALLGVAVGVAAGAVAVGWWIGPFVAGALVAGAVVVGLARRRIGGITGDVLGAVEQVVECTVLAIAAGLAEHHRLWWS